MPASSAWLIAAQSMSISSCRSSTSGPGSTISTAATKGVAGAEPFELTVGVGDETDSEQPVRPNANKIDAEMMMFVFFTGFPND